MKSRLAELLKGKIEYRAPEVTFAAEVLKGTLQPEKKLSMDVSVVSGNNVPMHLFYFSENPRVKVSQPFSIGKTGKLTLEINTVGLEPQSVLEGGIDILYNGGEKKLPYSFTVGLGGQSGTDRSFLSLDEFVAFAEENFSEAERIFSWKEFLDMPFMKELHLTGLYHTFSEGSGKKSGLREFLKAAGYDFLEEPSQQNIKISEKEALLSEMRESAFSREKIRNSLLLLYYSEGELSGRGYLKPGKTSVREKFETLSRKFPKDSLIRLLLSGAVMREGNLNEAKEMLISLQDQVQKERIEKKDVYCLFLYLASTVQRDEERLTMCRKLCHKYYMDGVRSPLMFELEYTLNEEFREDHTRAFSLLFQFFNMYPGHPAAYMEAAALFNRTTEDINVLSEFELRTLLYGLRHNMFTEKKLFEILSHELKNPKLLNLYMLVLKLGYHKFGNTELLQAVCNVYLQQRKAGGKYYPWYREALDKNLVIPGLYEFYLASVPKDYSGSLPRNVVRYFGLGKETSGIPLDFLYMRVVTEYGDDEEIRDLYREKITAYALNKLRLEEYSVRMIPVFREVLKPEYLNAENAPGMLEAFYLCHVHTKLQNVTRVVVHYPQLREEASYALSASEALLPIFSSEAVIAFEDRFGTRFFDPEMTKTQVYSDEELKKSCMTYVNDSLLSQLGEADEILKNGALREQDVFIVTDLIKNRRIDSFYRARLYETLIDLAKDPSMAHVDCCDFLLEADYGEFTAEYRARFLEVLIGRKYYREAFKIILEYGAEGLSDESLILLAENIMSEPVAKGDRTLLSICLRLYKNGKASAPVLDFLAEYYSGSSADMMNLLKTLRRKRIPQKELTKRALLTCFYVNEERYMDQLFDWHIGEKNRDDSLIYSYLILRSHEYFLEKRKLTENAFLELRKNIKELPDICLFALIKYYASAEEGFISEDREFLDRLLEGAVQKSVILGAYSELSEKIMLPPALQGKVFLSCKNENAVSVCVVGTVCPGGKFIHRTMKEIYPGVFTRAMVLYPGEWLKYYYLVQYKDGTAKEEEGGILWGENGRFSRGSRYDDITRLEKKADAGDMRETMELVKSMLLKDGMVDAIFPDEQ